MDSKRPLTPDEKRILDLLRQHYGPLNNLDSVFFALNDQACIFAKDRNGVSGMFVNLTVIPIMQKEQGVRNEDVFEQFLKPPGIIAVPREP